MDAEHVVSVRPRTVFMVVSILLGTVAVVWVFLQAERVLIWTFASLLLALALNPAVDALQRHGLHRRGAAAAVVYLLVTAVIAGIGALIIPTLVQQVGDFIDAVPGYVQQLTAGAVRSASSSATTRSSSVSARRSPGAAAAPRRWPEARAPRSTSPAAS
jgi:predicted PurR-regulated permease PerM